MSSRVEGGVLMPFGCTVASNVLNSLLRFSAFDGFDVVNELKTEKGLLLCK